VTEIPAAVAAELARLRAENARLLKMLELSPRQAAPPGPAQAGFFEAPLGPGSVVLPDNPGPHDTQGGEPGRGQGRAGPGGPRGHQAGRASLDEDPAGGGGCGPGPVRRGHPGRAGRPDARAGRVAAACCLDAQPAVLREAADARLHLGHPPVPAVLRRDRRRRPDRSARHAQHGHRTRRAGRQKTGSGRRARGRRRAGLDLLGRC
jgi:hypothetical protein